MFGASGDGMGISGRDGSDSSINRPSSPLNDGEAKGRSGPVGRITTASTCNSDVIETLTNRVDHRGVTAENNLRVRPGQLSTEYGVEGLPTHLNFDMGSFTGRWYRHAIADQ